MTADNLLNTITGLSILEAVPLVLLVAIAIFWSRAALWRWVKDAARVGERAARELRRAPTWALSNYVVLVIVLGGLLTGGAIIAYLWDIGRLLIRAVDELRSSVTTGAASPEDFRNYATGIAVLLGALAASATLLFQLIRVWINERTATTAEQGMITDRINKAVEGLGAEKTVKRPVRSADGTLTYEEATEPNLEVRVGAVLALERIARNAPEDHLQIMEILCAYLRENACLVNIGTEEAPNWQQRVDTQTAITVIGCRTDSATHRAREAAKGRPLDLRYANLQAVDMSNGQFAGALFDGTRLDGAQLERANLQGAQLGGADLQGADLEDADLQGAELRRANLQRAQLEGADLQGADLDDADLQGAQLWRANLQGAQLWDANLQGAELGRANLQGAALGRANLQGAELWRANLQEASLLYANLQEAYLNTTNLRGCYMAFARLRSVDFTQDTKFDRASLEEAFGVQSGIGRCTLPGGDYPAHWHRAAEVEEDGAIHEKAFNQAFRAWVESL